MRFLSIVVCHLLLVIVPIQADDSVKTELKGKPHYRFKALEHPLLGKVGGQWDTVQDQYGFIWFAGSGGVARYDGYDIISYRHDPNDPHSLSNNYVSQLLVDSQGRLWAATRWGLSQYDYLTDRFINYVHDPDNSASLIHNFVWSLLEDRSGNLWVGTDGGLELFDPETKSFKHYTVEEGNPHSLSDNIVEEIYQDKNGALWIGTREGGVNVFDINTQRFTIYKHDPNDTATLTSNEIYAFHEDKTGTMWVGTGNGLNAFDKKTGTFKRYYNNPDDPHSLSGNLVRSIMEDENGDLWIASDGGGVNIYDRTNDRFFRYSYDAGSDNGLPNNAVRALFEDRQGTMWISHFPAGVTTLDKYASAITTYRHDPLNDNSLSNSDILSSIEDSDANLWVGTEFGLNRISSRTGDITRYIHDPNNLNSLQANAVLAIYEDDQGNIWIGTWGGGLVSLNPETHTFTRYPEFNAERALSFYQGDDKILWIGSENGLKSYNRETGIFEHYPHNPKDDNSILRLGLNVIRPDGTGKLWLGMDTGLCLFDPKTKNFTRYVHDPDDSASIGNGWITHLFVESSGNVWITTGSNGVNYYNRAKNTFIQYDSKSGLGDDIVGGVVQDAEGSIWFGTGGGLSRYDKATNSFNTLTDEHGLAGNLHKRPAIVLTRDNNLVFGSSKGLSIFNPSDIPKNLYAPPVVLTDFQIFYKPVPLGDASPLQKKIIATDHITLNYKQSVFSFNFSGLNYVMPERNQYAYKLEGFDADWVMGGDRRSASYTNLDSGKYTFRVRAANNEGVWNDDGVSLKIRVLPPPWKTWWAYTIYVCIVMGIIGKYLYNQRQKRLSMIRQNQILEEKVTERTRELSIKNNDIQSMLSNMRQGLCTIESDGNVHHEYAKHLEEILETESIAGESIKSLLFDKTTLGSDDANQVDEAIKSIVGEDEMNFEFNSHLLPQEVDADFGAMKNLALDWSPVLEDDMVSKLMVSIRDVTDLKQAEKEAENQKRELDIISQLIKVSAKKFMNMEKSVAEFLQVNEETINAHNAYDEAAVALLFRNMHTIKGNCRTYGLSYLSNVVHDVENVYTEMQKAEAPNWNVEQLITDLGRVRVGLEEYQKVFYDVLERGSQTLDSDLSPHAADVLQSAIKTLEPAIDSSLHAESLQSLKALLASSDAQPFSEVIEDIIASLPSIAEQLGKPTPKVDMNGGEMLIANSATDLINNVCSHLLRNCLDHGIEESHERTAVGKPEAGTIFVNIDTHADHFRVALNDDGKGLNVARLYSKGIEQNLWSDSDSPSIHQIADLVFMSGMSTKEVISDISGRGVGMDAVKQFVQQQGGTIELVFNDPESVDVKNVEFVPFTVELRLPLTCCVVNS